MSLTIWTKPSLQLQNNPLIAAELTSALAEAAHLDEAEAIGAAACARFRYHPRTFMQHAETAMRRNDLNVALTRWIDGSKRFPQADNFLRGIVKARLAMIDRGGNILPAVICKTPLPDNGISIRKILMEFESLAVQEWVVNLLLFRDLRGQSHSAYCVGQESRSIC